MQKQAGCRKKMNAEDVFVSSAVLPRWRSYRRLPGVELV
jgi:hypothetical protein